jgi:DNA mismatch endonuclease (patch repair protein)
VALGGGRSVAYPEPSSDAASQIGKANRRTGTGPELALRSALHRLGYRYRSDHLVRADGVRVHADLAFTRWRVAVFVDGCFWHGCPSHGTQPRANAAYWQPKLATNRERDRRVDRALTAAGWSVVRIWEHESAADAVDAVVAALRARGGARAHTT